MKASEIMDLTPGSERLSSLRTRAAVGDEQAALDYVHFCAWRKLCHEAGLSKAQRKRVFTNLVSSQLISVRVEAPKAVPLG